MISGASGFIGKNLTIYLKDKFNLILLNRNDLANIIINENFELSELKIDAIIHCAAAVSVPKSKLDPYIFYNFNINSTLALANYCLKKKIPRFIYLNTYGYGNTNKNPLDESAIVEPHSHYTKSKYIAEKTLFDFLEDHTNVVSLRIFNLYGLHQPKSFLIPSIVSQAQNSNEIIVNNTYTKRDYLYVKDLISLIYKIIITHGVKGVFNVGTGESHNIDYIINCLERILNKKLNIKSANIYRTNEIIDCYANNEKVMKTFEWKINYKIFDGLKDLLL